MKTVLPKAIIVDIDGTLAERITDRSPYDWKRVGEDGCKESIKKIVNLFADHGVVSVIIFSGRDEVCRPETEDWLRRNGIVYDELFMRPKGNNEKDSIIKKRLYEENIEGNYEVELVIDDRDQVVKMWREELVLTCLQVDYGNF